ncbi:MAG TPA: dihydrofolate reductase family protein [Hyphomonadaceae bacterium]|jgi:dihydrofolate reductase
MPILTSFISLSLDGCYADANSDMNWAHSQDPEQAEFTASNAKGGGALVFGRITYEMMASFWPTPQAAQMMPEVAAQMNTLPKIVFSRTIKSAGWQNSRVVSADLVGELSRLKAGKGPDMTILGSGSIVAQVATAGLLDELQIMLVPIALGAGKRLFDGVPRSLAWRRDNSRQFSNGNVFISYRPA